MKINVWRSLLVIFTVLWCVALLPQVQASEQTNPVLTGYRWVDNKNPQPFPETPAGEDLSWIEISTTGDDLLAAPGLSDLNDGSIGITTPFLPTYYGNLYGMGSAPLYVSINGFVSFGTPVTGVTSAYNTTLPSSVLPNNVMAVFWDDLDASNGGHIYYDVQGIAPNRTIIIQWSNLSFNGQTANLNFQLQIFETVTATPYGFVFGNMTSPNAARATGSSATIGVEDSNGTSGTLYSYNIPNNIISNETTIGFYPPQDLLGVPTFTKGAGFADHMRILWQQAITPSIHALHFIVNAPKEEDIELTGIEIQAALPDNPAALDFDESEYISGINIYEDVDRNAVISAPERNNNLILAWAPTAQQPFTNNGILVLPLTNQNIIALASKVYLIEVSFDQSAGKNPLENEGFKLRLHRVSYRGITSNASLVETLDFETGSIYVDDGENPYSSFSIMPYNYGSHQMLALPGGTATAIAFKVTVGSVEAVRLEALTIRGISTGDITQDITSVDVYLDQNANGVLDTGEPVAATTFAFTTGDVVTITMPLGGDFAAGYIGYYVAEFSFRNPGAADMSMLNTSNQIIIEMAREYLNLDWYSSPSLLGGTIIGGVFQPRVQQFPRPAILCDDAVGRKIVIGTQSAINQDQTGLSLEGGGCFVATAAFGEYVSSTVVSLCSFRDSVLNETIQGASLVNLYYSVSPVIADSISESAGVRSIISNVLDQITD